ncbi:MAG: hypothetical protein AAGF74_16365 [Pseudomonadota bacterium]
MQTGRWPYREITYAATGPAEDTKSFGRSLPGPPTGLTLDQRIFAADRGKDHGIAEDPHQKTK